MHEREQFDPEKIKFRLKEIELLTTDALKKLFKLEQKPERFVDEIELTRKELVSLEYEKKSLESQLASSEISTSENTRVSSTKEKERPDEFEPIVLKTGSGLKYLVDPETKRQISIPYADMLIEDGAVIAQYPSGNKVLLSPRTGKEISHGYVDIFLRDGLIIGKYPTGSEFLLKRNGKEATSVGYERIERRGKHVIGIDWRGGEKIIF